MSLWVVAETLRCYVTEISTDGMMDYCRQFDQPSLTNDADNLLQYHWTIHLIEAQSINMPDACNLFLIS